MKVTKVHVDGVRRTKNDFVSGVIEDSGILTAKTIEEVVLLDVYNYWGTSTYNVSLIHWLAIGTKLMQMNGHNSCVATVHK